MTANVLFSENAPARNHHNPNAALMALEDFTVIGEAPDPFPASEAVR